MTYPHFHFLGVSRHKMTGLFPSFWNEEVGHADRHLQSTALSVGLQSTEYGVEIIQHSCYALLSIYQSHYALLSTLALQSMYERTPYSVTINYAIPPTGYSEYSVP
jgi:hypothetical protein